MPTVVSLRSQGSTFSPSQFRSFPLMISSFLHQYQSRHKRGQTLKRRLAICCTHYESGTSSGLRLQLQGLSSLFQANDPVLWQPVSGLGEPRADSESAVPRCHRCTHPHILFFSRAKARKSVICLFNLLGIIVELLFTSS